MVQERSTHWSESDLRFLVRSVVRRRTDYERIAEIIRDKPDLIDVMLDDPSLAERVEADQTVLLQISPFLLFSILLRRAQRELKESLFTLEVGEEGRLPVFDAQEAASLLDDHRVRLYLAEMLASFTRVETVTLVFQGRRGLERRNFSELNVDDLLALSQLVGESHRYSFFKRVADVCLFLTGMFPEHLVGWAGGAAGARRDSRTLGDYEVLGKEFYQKAAELEERSRGQWAVVLRLLAEAFTLARKPLNLIALRYIPQQRRQWFHPGLSSSASL